MTAHPAGLAAEPIAARLQQACDRADACMAALDTVRDCLDASVSMLRDLLTEEPAVAADLAERIRACAPGALCLPLDQAADLGPALLAAVAGTWAEFWLTVLAPLDGSAAPAPAEAA